MPTLPNEDNAFVTLPEDVLQNIGSFLNPRDRSNIRVSRALSIPFSRRTRRMFRISERKTIKLINDPTITSTHVRNFIFASNPYGEINPEDLNTLRYETPYYRDTVFPLINEYIHRRPLDIRWNHLPDAWKRNIQFDDFYAMFYYSGLCGSPDITSFFNKSLWGAEELSREIMRHGDRTLVRSFNLLQDRNILLDALEYPTLGIYQSAASTLQDLTENIGDATDLSEERCEQEIKKIVDHNLTVELFIEHFNIV
jgi:hypothetical protein